MAVFPHALEGVVQDVRYIGRTWRRRPGFAAVAILTLALGIATNIAAFSLVRSLLLRPYTFRDLDRLVLLRETRAGDAAGFQRVSVADFLDLRRDDSTLEELAAFRVAEMSLTGAGDPERVRARLVTANLFPMLEARTERGRVFQPGEDEPGRERGALLSHGLWQRIYGGDPRALGADVFLNGVAFTVIGVMPAGFNYPRGVDLWVPLALTAAEREDRRTPSLFVLARARSGQTLPQTRDGLGRFSAMLAERHPDTNRGRELHLLPLRKEQYEYTLPLFSMLQAAALIVLLLACANASSLLLTKRLGQRNEVAMRLALGASPIRVGWQFVLECLLVSLAAGVVAVVVSFWTVDLIRNAIPPGIAIWVAGWNDLRVDGAVLVFTLAVVVGVGLVLGLIGGFHREADSTSNTLRAGGRVAPAKHRLRSALTAAQVGLALILLAGAAWMLQGFTKLVDVFQTLEPEGVLTMGIALPEERYPDDSSAARLFELALSALASLPSVESVTATSNLPASNVPSPRTPFTIQTRPPASASEMPSGDLQTVGGDYFGVFRLPILAGRALQYGDGPDSPPVAVISRAMARRYWPGEDPLGQRIRLGPWQEPGAWWTVVGVVSDIKQNWFDPEPRPIVYVHYRQRPRRTMSLAVRSLANAPNPYHLGGPVREAIRAIDSQQAVSELDSMRQVIDDSLSPIRIIGILMSVFGGVALVLATVGLYGLVASNVAQRTRELAVRMALGAPPGQVLRMVLVETLRLAGAGLAVALPVAIALNMVLAMRLFGLVTTRPGPLVGLIGLLALVAAAAAFVPARRATRVDPATVLRCE